MDALTLLGSSLIQTGNYGEAGVILNRAVKLRPVDANVHYQLGLLDFRLGRTADAQREMARYRELAPRNPQGNARPGVDHQLKLSGPPRS